MFGPKATPDGMQLTIVGSGFGDKQGNGFVTIADTKVEVVGWTESRIVITMQAGKDGKLIVHQKGTNSRPVTVYPAINRKN